MVCVAWKWLLRMTIIIIRTTCDMHNILSMYYVRHGTREIAGELIEFGLVCRDARRIRRLVSVSALSDTPHT